MQVCLAHIDVMPLAIGRYCTGCDRQVSRLQQAQTGSAESNRPGPPFCAGQNSGSLKLEGQAQCAWVLEAVTGEGPGPNRCSWPLSCGKNSASQGQFPPREREQCRTRFLPCPGSVMPWKSPLAITVDHHRSLNLNALALQVQAICHTLCPDLSCNAREFGHSNAQR